MELEAFIFAGVLAWFAHIYVLARRRRRTGLWRLFGKPVSENQRIRTSARYRSVRLAVLRRDRLTCQTCGKVGGLLEVDHILPFAYFPKLRFEMSNLRTLCPRCHKLTPTYGAGAKRLYGHIKQSLI